MAQRRMFSKRITSSTRFLKMPPSTQALYFHLGMNADDDGVVEAYVIMNQLGATEDDLRILSSKQFVTILNDDLVSYINDWTENNKIRADRKVDSIYKPLLLKIVPGITMLEPRKRADTGKQSGSPTIGRPVVNQRTAQDRLGKDRLGKDSTIAAAYDDDYRDPQEKNSSVVVNDSLKNNQGEEYSPSFHDVTQFWQEQGFGALSPMTKDKLLGWWHDFQEDGSSPQDATAVLIKGMEICIDAGARHYGYLNAILQNWEAQRLTTVAAIEAHDEQRKAAQSSPGNRRPTQEEIRNTTYHDSDWAEIDARYAAEDAAEAAAKAKKNGGEVDG